MIVGIVGNQQRDNMKPTKTIGSLPGRTSVGVPRSVYKSDPWARANSDRESSGASRETIRRCFTWAEMKDKDRVIKGWALMSQVSGDGR